MGAFGAGESFFTVKESLEAFAAANGLSFRFERGAVSYLHPGITADIYCGGEKIGHLGKLRYEVVEKLNIAEGKKTDLNVIIAEINYSLLERLFKKEIKYRSESGFASVRRDLSLTVDKKTDCAAVMDAISAADKRVSGVKFIDIYESEKLGLGKKSLTFTLTLSDSSADVTDVAADEAMAAIVAGVEKTIGAKMRA